jgi:prolyl oligopeptidase
MMGRAVRVVVGAVLTNSLWAQVPAAPVQAKAPAVAKKQPVTDEYHGVKVVDQYRWLEDGGNPEVKQWVAAENAYTRSLLDKSPYRETIKRDLLAKLKRSSVRYSRVMARNGMFFMLKRDPSRQQPILIMTKSADDLSQARTIVDPNVLNTQGHLAIDWFKPSLDGSRVAVAMSEGGSEDASLHIYNVATAKQFGEVVPRVSFPTGGGSMAWLPDGKSFFYTRYPQGNERPAADANFYQQVWLHRIGTPASTDTYAIGKEFPRIAETVLDTDSTGKYVLASVANGDGGEYEHFLRTPDGKWQQITRFEDKIVSVSIGEDGALYLISRKDAPRGKLVRMPIAGGTLASATTIVPEGKASMEIPDQGSDGVLPAVTATRIYVTTIEGGPNQISIYDHAGKSFGTVPLKGPVAVGNLLPLSGDSIAFQASGYLDPPTLYIFDGKQNVKSTAVRMKPQEDLSGIEVERAFAKSADGTAIPMSIIHSKNMKRNGTTPTLVYGYGGFGISMRPSYVEGSEFLLWLEQGGTLVIANLRGGTEYGEAWHSAGNLLHKQNVFNDFAACAHYLVEQKYSSSAHMVAMGGSNGGLLMGAELTQHPSDFRAVVSEVGIYDMLRTELDPNGAFNVTEYGTVKDPAQFKALYAYSPYHHVDKGAAYPSILMTTGDNDGRVNPAHSRKMIAALQASTASKNPILLRTSANAGHGMGTSLNDQVEQTADIYAFIFGQLGMEYRANQPPINADKRQ